MSLSLRVGVYLSRYYRRHTLEERVEANGKGCLRDGSNPVRVVADPSNAKYLDRQTDRQRQTETFHLLQFYRFAAGRGSYRVHSVVSQQSRLQAPTQFPFPPFQNSLYTARRNAATGEFISDHFSAQSSYSSIRLTVKHYSYG